MGQELRRVIPWGRMEPSSLSAVGVWFYSVSTDRYLYLMRNDNRHPENWALPGGKMLPGESLLSAIERECREELGSMPDFVSLSPLEKFTDAKSGFSYHTFFAVVKNEFVPQLNHEHLGYAWIAAGVWPKNMHPGLWNTVNFDAIAGKIELIRNRAKESL